MKREHLTFGALAPAANTGFSGAAGQADAHVLDGAEGTPGRRPATNVLPAVASLLVSRPSASDTTARGLSTQSLSRAYVQP